MWAQPILIAYQSSDLSYFTSAAVPSSSTATTTIATPSSTAGTAIVATTPISLGPSVAAPTNISPTPSSGLSGGTIAGISIGAVALCGFGGVFAWFFLRHRRRRKLEYKNPAVEKDATPKRNAVLLSELQGTSRVEADGRALPTELVGKILPWELDQSP